MEIDSDCVLRSPRARTATAMTHKHANRRDANEKVLVEFWQAAGCYWIQMLPGQGCDGLLIDGPVIHLVEIKGERLVLTECEWTLKNQVETRGGKYNVVQTLEDARELISR